MGIKILPLVLAVLSASSFASGYGEGLVRRGADGETYLYTTGTLKSGEEVQIQYPKENGDLACCETTSSDGKPLPQTDVIDALHEADVHAYKLKARYAL